jgi:hypothetical protein
MQYQSLGVSTRELFEPLLMLYTTKLERLSLSKLF